MAIAFTSDVFAIGVVDAEAGWAEGPELRVLAELA